MSNHEPEKVAFPESLRATFGGIDPFASPSRLGAHPHGPTPAGAPQPGTPQSEALDQSPFPCPCWCGCANATTMPVSAIESFSAARSLRCAACAGEDHGDVPRADQVHLVADQAPEPAAAMGGGDVRVTGTKSGESFVIRKAVPSEEEAEWDREAAAETEKRRRTAANEKFFATIDDRFDKPLAGEPLLPIVRNRLDRMRSPQGRHSTSLLVNGSLGSGKTWAGYMYVRAAVDEGLLWPQEITHGTERQLLMPLVFAPFGEKDKRIDAFLDRRKKLIFIDDVGSWTAPTLAEQHSLYYDIVNWAYGAHRTVVITTNLTLRAEGTLIKHIGERAYARLATMIGKEGPFFRDAGNKRAEMVKQWETEWEALVAEQSAPS